MHVHTFKSISADFTNSVFKRMESCSFVCFDCPLIERRHTQAAEKLIQLIDPLYKCTWMPSMLMSPALAAHTGPSMVGVAFAPQAVFEGLP